VNPSDETLMAYVDGELGVAAREQVETALAADPEVARRVAAHQALRGRLRATFDKVLEEPVPAQLAALVRTGAAEPARGQLVQFPGKQAPRRAWLQWSSLAASFVLGALLWQFAARLYAPGLLSENHGGFVASGALARALSGQLSAEQSPSGTVQVGVSFRSRQGDYCRTFRLRGARAATAGLACRDNTDWRVQALAHDETSPVTTGQYRQAASSLPPAVVRAVDDMIAGDPLDAVAEAQARAAGWRGRP
jgi:hypothetical protein